MNCVGNTAKTWRNINAFYRNDADSTVESESNQEMSSRNLQDIPLDRKFSALFDGMSRHFVSVDHFSQLMNI